MKNLIGNMCPEHYLEYLCLNSIMQGWMGSIEFCNNRPEICEAFWFADGTRQPLNLTKLKARITELQKMFLEEYLCNNYNSKEN